MIKEVVNWMEKYWGRRRRVSWFVLDPGGPVFTAMGAAPRVPQRDQKWP